MLGRTGCLDTCRETAVAGAGGVRLLPLVSWDRGAAFEEGDWGILTRSSAGGRFLPKMLLKAVWKHSEVKCTRLNLGWNSAS